MSLLRRRLSWRAGMLVPAARLVTGHRPSLHLQSTCRFYFTSTCVCCAERSRAHDTAASSAEATGETSGNTHESALYADVAKRLFSLQQIHSSAAKGVSTAFNSYQHVALEAWNLLQSIPEDEVDRMSTRDLAEIVQAYNYFASFWEYGMEGPADVSSSNGAGGRAHGASGAAVESEPYKPSFDYPLVERHDAAATGEGSSNDGVTRAQNVMVEVVAPPKRANPLDEILDF